MRRQRLEFCEVILRDDGILEVVADEGVEVDENMVRELEKVFSSLVDSPTGLLVNRMYQYSLTHKAMVAIAKLKVVKAIAILVYYELSRTVAESQRIYEFNMEVFTSEDAAIQWLKDQLK